MEDPGAKLLLMLLIVAVGAGLIWGGARLLLGRRPTDGVETQGPDYDDGDR